MSISQPGPNPPVPEPFWHRSWRSLWRWKPACIECGERLFANRATWEAHYLRGIHFNPHPVSVLGADTPRDAK